MPHASDVEGAVETRGLEPVPDNERKGRVRDLIPTWVAANISVLLLAMGASLVVADKLNFWQALIAAFVAPVISYGLVGFISIAGKRGGAPGMALSRSVFGQRGNLLPGSLIWIARWGWETINAVTGAYALLTVLDICFGIHSSTPLIIVTLLLFVAATFLISGLGINALHVCNKWSTYLFGIFSVLVLVYLIADTDWSAVFAKPAGTTASLVAGIGLIAAGGLSWVPTGPDFARYLPRRSSGGGMIGASIGGAGIVVLPMVLMGAVMAVSTPDLANASDPVSFLGKVLPMWIAVPYLLIAVVGMVLINAMSMYSAGFTALTLGIKVPRAWAVSVNAAISVVLGLILMLAATSFLGSFVAFLSLLAVAFSAWIGVFGADMLLGRTYDPVALMDTTRTSAYWYRGGFSPAAVIAWLVALVTGMLFTTAGTAGSAWFTGPFADSWLGRNGLGWVVTILVSGVLYAVLPKPGPKGRPGAAGQGPDADREPATLPI